MLNKISAGVSIAALMVAFAGTAMADGVPGGGVKDVPAASPMSWTGFYIGANLGYAKVDGGASITPGPIPGTPSGTFTNGLLTGGSIPGRLNGDGDGVIGGLQLGYNLQMGTMVAGIEVDFGGSTAGGHQSVRILPADFTSAYNANLAWLSTVRGRIGVLLTPSILAYATGGFAFGEVKRSYSWTGPGDATGGQKNSIDTGWTVGGGLEWAMTSKVSLGMEYLYAALDGVRFNADQFRGACIAFQDCATRVRGSDTELHVARLKLNFKF